MKCLEAFTTTWMEKNEMRSNHVNCKIIGTALNNKLLVKEVGALKGERAEMTSWGLFVDCNMVTYAFNSSTCNQHRGRSVICRCEASKSTRCVSGSQDYIVRPCYHNNNSSKQNRHLQQI